MASLPTDPADQNPFQAIEFAFEDKIKGVLENIVGVGTVDVMVTVDSTEELVVQRNVKDSQQLTEETDANGGKRHMTQYTRDGEIITYEISGDQTPIVTKKLKPQIRGARRCQRCRKQGREGFDNRCRGKRTECRCIPNIGRAA